MRDLALEYRTSRGRFQVFLIAGILIPPPWIVAIIMYFQMVDIKKKAVLLADFKADKWLAFIHD